MYTDAIDLNRQNGMSHYRACEPKKNWPVITEPEPISPELIIKVKARHA